MWCGITGCAGRDGSRQRLEEGGGDVGGGEGAVAGDADEEAAVAADADYGAFETLKGAGYYADSGAGTQGISIGPELCSGIGRLRAGGRLRLTCLRHVRSCGGCSFVGAVTCRRYVSTGGVSLGGCGVGGGVGAVGEEEGVGVGVAVEDVEDEAEHFDLTGGDGAGPAVSVGAGGAGVGGERGVAGVAAEGVEAPCGGADEDEMAEEG